MKTLLPSEQRDAAIDRMLPWVPAHGWTWQAIAGDEPATEPGSIRMARELFPDGGPGMIEAFCDLFDRRMLAAAADLPSSLRSSARLRATLALRLAHVRPYKAAVRRAVAIMCLPGRAPLAARCTYRTVDALWMASFDKSVDFSWYTKRASLALIYPATLALWLGNDDPDDQQALKFFDRRVAALRALGRWRASLRRQK